MIESPAPPCPRARRRGRRTLRPWLTALLGAPALALAQAPPVADGLDADTLQRIRALGEQAGARLALGVPAGAVPALAAPAGAGLALQAPAGASTAPGTQAGASAPGAPRVEIEPGRLDPRLRLAPCEHIEPYLPPGARAWGRSRIGLRCVRGATPWNVTLPVTVKVFAPAWVAAAPLPAGSVLEAAQLHQAEVDWAAAATPPVADAGQLVGRQLVRPLPAGAPVRLADLRQRQWFAAGDTVQLVARGAGFSVGGEAQALGPGIEGQPVRVRTDNGRVLSGLAVGRNRVEVQL